ncbi:MAG TPA: hypothetical protein VFE48_16770 [Methylomirabilota bacterium]|nr:hypothetical protein [Methylomirabilota bacterium]
MTDASDTAGPHREIHISNRATYWPLAPLDVVVGATLLGRVLLRASPVGALVQGAVLGAYAGHALHDWRARRGIRRIDFRREFGADLGHLVPMPRETRAAEVRTLAERLDAGFVAERLPRRPLAEAVDRALTRFIAGITGQHVRSSAKVRRFALVGLAFPFALGACDILSGDVAIFRDTGFLEPHIIVHEFAHRKGYWKELHAQVLGYLALASSEMPLLRQAALLERLHRNLRVLAGSEVGTFARLVEAVPLRPELRSSLLGLHPPLPRAQQRIEGGLRQLYDLRMRATGQTGLSDYDAGFTDFLYTFETSRVARQRPPAGGAIHRAG